MELAIVIVKNSRNWFFVHKRSPDKKRFPNLYGIGAGGKIKIGESPEFAAKRELKEELGLQTPIKFLFVWKYKNDLISVFFATSDKIIKPCKKEFSWSGWLSTEETDNLMVKKKMCPDTEMFYKKYRIEFEGACFE